MNTKPFGDPKIKTVLSSKRPLSDNGLSGSLGASSKKTASAVPEVLFSYPPDTGAFPKAAKRWKTVASDTILKSDANYDIPDDSQRRRMHGVPDPAHPVRWNENWMN